MANTHYFVSGMLVLGPLCTTSPTLHTIRLMSAVINSLYSFWWDLTNDWGLDLLASGSTRSREGSPRSPVVPSRQLSPASSSRSHESLSLLDQTSSSFDAKGPRGASYPYGLRAVLLYPLPVYPMVIFLNFILRMTWSIKLSSHLYSQSDGSMLIFWLEVAEVLRRWIWVFLRIEWEVVRSGRDKACATGNGIPFDDRTLPSTRKGEAFD